MQRYACMHAYMCNMNNIFACMGFKIPYVNFQLWSDHLIAVIGFSNNIYACP